MVIRAPGAPSRQWSATIIVWLGMASPLLALTITEVNYHPRDGIHALEFVEVFNETAEPIDLGGFLFSRGVDFVFPRLTFLGARSYLVVCADEDAVREAYGIENTIGNWSSSTALNNGGETLELVNASGAFLARVDYDDGGRWPAGADGSGFTLEICDPYGDMDDPTNWRESSARGGSPGRMNPDWPRDSAEFRVSINEALTLPGDGASAGWVELYNPAGVAVDLSGFHLSRNPRTLTAHTLAPESVVPPRGYLVVDESMLGFELAPDLEGKTFVALTTPGAERVVDARTFRPQVVGRSEARVPDGEAFLGRAVVPTPGAHNTLAEDVVINEIYYHPLADGPEFVELYNRSEASVDLSGWRFNRGLHYEFPAGTLLGARQYLAVTREPALLRARYGLGKASVVGPQNEAGRANFGALANGGERLRLIDTLGNVVDQLHYIDGGEWPRWADGGGSSLELIDAFADNAVGSAWDASDDAEEATVGHFEYEGRFLAPSEHELHFALVGAGIAQVDDVQVRRLENRLDVNTELLEIGASWRFFRGRSAPAGEWRTAGFDDNSWEFGVAPFGYGVGDENTVLVDMRGTYHSVFFRGEFVLTDLETLEGLFLEIHYDDGFVAFLNGASVGSRNLFEGASYTDRATESAESGAVERVDLLGGFSDRLRSGRNVLAVAVHNVESASRDFRFAARIVEGRETEELGPNLLADGRFDDPETLAPAPWPAAASTNWIFEGTHVRSGRSLQAPLAGPASLKIVATRPGDNKVNRIETSDAGLGAIEPGARYRVAFDARWVVGAPTLLSHGLYRGAEPPDIPASHALPLPATPGTPGALNSVTRRLAEKLGTANLGPTITNLSQDPALPGTSQGVSVTARIHDADGIADARVYYALGRPAEEGSDAVREVPMVESGVADVFVAEIPPQADSEVVLFWVVATDSAGRQGRYPTDHLERTHPLVLDAEGASVNDRRHLVYRVSSPAAGTKPSYRFWMHGAHEDVLDNQRLLSNDPVSGTLIFDDRLAFYETSIRFSGSPFARQKWTESYRLRMPKGRPLWGRFGKFNLENHQGDGALDGRERIANYLLRQSSGHIRVPYLNQWLVSFQVNERVVLQPREHVELPSREYLERWYGDDDDGAFFEMDDRHTINDSGFQESFREARVTYPPYGSKENGENREYYRYFFNPRGGNPFDDFDDLITLCRVLDPAATADVLFDDLIAETMDVEEFLRVFAIRLNTDDHDSWGARRGKNYYFYRPSVDGRWALLPWDQELTFGDPNAFAPPALDLTHRPVHLTNFDEVTRLLNRPRIQRRYYGILAQMIDSYFDPEFLAPYLDGLDGAGVLRTDVGRPGGFIASRRSVLADALRGVREDQVPFTITTNGGADFFDEGPEVKIEGLASVEVRTIRVLIDGAEPTTPGAAGVAEFSRTDLLGWKYSALLPGGESSLSFLAQGEDGVLIASDEVGVYVSGAGFRRGDGDESGRVNLTDAVVTLLFLVGRYVPRCEDALDSDDSGAVDVTDVLFLLHYLFLMGDSPPPPFALPGDDPTPDELGCRQR